MSYTLDTGSKPAIAQGLFNSLLDQIAGGKYSPGSRLPTERDIAAEAGVGRASVREALQDLERAGVVQIRQGSGAAVCERRLWSFRVLPAAIRSAALTGQIEILRDILDIALRIRSELVRTALTLCDGRLEKGSLDEARFEVRLAWQNRDSLSGFMKHDFAMNRAILVAARLEPVVWLLNDVSRVYLELVSLVPGPVPVDKDYVTLHEKIFTALETGSGPRALALSLAHVERHERRIRRALGLHTTSKSATRKSK